MKMKNIAQIAEHLVTNMDIARTQMREAGTSRRARKLVPAGPGFYFLSFDPSEYPEVEREPIIAWQVSPIGRGYVPPTPVTMGGYCCVEDDTSGVLDPDGKVRGQRGQIKAATFDEWVAMRPSAPPISWPESTVSGIIIGCAWNLPGEKPLGSPLDPFRVRPHPTLHPSFEKIVPEPGTIQGTQPWLSKPPPNMRVPEGCSAVK